MIKNKVLVLVIYAVLFVAIWNGLDFLYNLVIARDAYQFEWAIDLAAPVGLAIVTGLLIFWRNREK